MPQISDKFTKNTPHTASTRPEHTWAIRDEHKVRTESKFVLVFSETSPRTVREMMRFLGLDSDMSRRRPGEDQDKS